MDPGRVGTSHSQKAFASARELEHSAPEVYEHPAPEVYHPEHQPSQTFSKDTEKPGFGAQSAQNLYPPPQYTPGTSTEYPSALEVPPVELPAPAEEGKICGIRRGLFLLLLGLGGLILLGIAVGVGVGVGLGSQKSGSTESPSSGASNGTSTTESVAPTETAWGSSCPGISSTQYTAANGKKFLHLCGLDYAGPGEATDIDHAGARTFEQCMEYCSEREECTGAGWGPPIDDNKARGTCWMKKGLLKSHTATPEWNFAVLIDAPSTTKSSSVGPSSSTSASYSTSSTPAPDS